MANYKRKKSHRAKTTCMCKLYKHVGNSSLRRTNKENFQRKMAKEEIKNDSSR